MRSLNYSGIFVKIVVSVQSNTCHHRSVPCNDFLPLFERQTFRDSACWFTPQTTETTSPIAGCVAELAPQLGVFLSSILITVLDLQ